MEFRIRKLVLDVAIPTKGTNIIGLAKEILNVPGVKGVNITVDDVDVDVLGLTVVVHGDGINYEAVEDAIERAGGVIHSLDQVVAGDVEEIVTTRRKGTALK